LKQPLVIRDEYQLTASSQVVAEPLLLLHLWEWAIALHGRVLVPLGWLQVIYCDMLLLSVYYLGYYFVLACC
jgi:hypothetical protein